MKYWKRVECDEDGVHVTTNDNYTVDLPVAVGMELLEALDRAIVMYRRGRYLDGVAWCASCGRSGVNPDAGEDTCATCLRSV